MFPLAFMPLLKNGKYTYLSMLPLLFFPHFNSICFLKLGLTFSYFEVYLFLLCFIILIKGFNYKHLFIFDTAGKIFIIFLAISLLSIVIAHIRISIGDLTPNLKLEHAPIARSLMSLNRVFVYPILLNMIRIFYKERGVDIHKYFILFLALSGIFPTIATYMQACGIEFTMLFNNPSYAILGILTPNRPFGLSYEASFYSIMCLFSFIGAYYAMEYKYINRTKSMLLMLFYFFGTILCISRTGMLILLVFVIWKNYQSIGIKKVMLALILLFVLSQIEVMGFNIIERFTSSFDDGADASNIERFGSAYALVELALDKALLFGVGIYNYGYYILDYVPAELLALKNYSLKDEVVSFNFIVQLFAEWGGFIFSCFIIYVFRLLSSNKQFVFMADWFLFFAVVSFSVQFMNFSLPFLIILYSPNLRINKHLINA